MLSPKCSEKCRSKRTNSGLCEKSFLRWWHHERELWYE